MRNSDYVKRHLFEGTFKFGNVFECVIITKEMNELGFNRCAAITNSKCVFFYVRPLHYILNKIAPYVDFEKSLEFKLHSKGLGLFDVLATDLTRSVIICTVNFKTFPVSLKEVIFRQQSTLDDVFESLGS